MLLIAEARARNRQVRRYLHLLLVYGGKGGAARVGEQMGLCTESLDMVNDWRENSRCMVGLLLYIYMVKSLVVKGIAWMSPDCSSWLACLKEQMAAQIIQLEC